MKFFFCILIPRQKSSDLITAINDQDKTLNKDGSNTIKTAIDYPRKLALDKFSHVTFLNWHKLRID